MRKVYWPQLTTLTVHLCKYLQANRLKLPTELQADALIALTALQIFCDIVVEYDRTHARGGTV